MMRPRRRLDGGRSKDGMPHRFIEVCGGATPSVDGSSQRYRVVRLTDAWAGGLNVQGSQRCGCRRWCAWSGRVSTSEVVKLQEENLGREVFFNGGQVPPVPRQQQPITVRLVGILEGGGSKTLNNLTCNRYNGTVVFQLSSHSSHLKELQISALSIPACRTLAHHAFPRTAQVCFTMQLLTARVSELRSTSIDA